MLIPVLTEPNYQNSLWARLTLEGLGAEASKRKYKLRPLDGEAFRDIDYDALFDGGKRAVIIIGTSISWVPQTLRFFSEKNVASVLISFDPMESAAAHGMVRMDYVNAMHTLLGYLEGCGCKSVAMYGFNPNSSADAIKLRCFESWRKGGADMESRNVFLNYASLSGCYDAFHRVCANFDAVICANDVVAVSLLRRLKEDGISVPEELFVTSFGNSALARRVRPTLTSISMDHREMGRQAVTLYAFLYRQRETASVSVRLRGKLMIRESTAMTPASPAARRMEGDMGSAVNFYSDEEAQRLLMAERLLTACDEADEALLRCVLRGEAMEALEKRFYLTASALHYRKKRLMNLTGCATAAELTDFLTFCQQAGLFD